MKKKLIHAGILTVVFIVAVVFFEYMTSRGNDNMMEDLGNATLPRVYFSVDGYGLNPMNGYVKEMEIPSMRDGITPVTNHQVQINIESEERKVQSIEYAVYTIDGKKELYRNKISKPGEQEALNFEEGILSEERVLMLTLQTEEGNVNYYTRVVDAAGTNVTACLDYVYNFHENALVKAENTGIGKAIEPSEDGDNTTFSHVTIHSDYDHVTWGGLEPQVTGGERWKLLETNENYSSVLLEYEVSCKGEENETDLYTVKEFFRVRSAAGNMYLLNYDRIMDQVFDGSKQVLNEKGLLLGIASSEVPYAVNADGTVVSFVQANELWNYNRDTDELSLLFSFRDAENTDVRNKVSDHTIDILSMDKDGNTTFAVTGYMNRGSHEGRVGAGIYYYNIGTNSIEEKAFIESDKAASIAEEDLGKLVYYSTERNFLYALVGGSLHEIDLGEKKERTVVEGLKEGQYTVSEDGGMVAYQTGDGEENGAQVVVMNLLTGKEYKVDAKEGESMIPLGFVETDFVSGRARQEDAGKTVIGEQMTPMYQIEIRNQKNKVVKTYEPEGYYVSDVRIENGMITLNRVAKNGESYSEAAADYVANNKEKEKSNIMLESYATELKQTQVRLNFMDGIQDKSAKVLKPKQVMAEDTKRYSFEDEDSRSFYVYGLGKFQGSYKKAGEAVVKADKVDGVVVLSDQRYVWERGNWDPSYGLTGQETLIASIRDRLTKGETVLEILNDISGGEVLELRGCSADQLVYLINQNTPVIGLTEGGKAVILTGYNNKNVAYIDAQSGQQNSVLFEQMDQMTAAGGGIYLGYLSGVED